MKTNVLVSLGILHIKAYILKVISTAVVPCVSEYRLTLCAFNDYLLTDKKGKDSFYRFLQMF